MKFKPKIIIPSVIAVIAIIIAAVCIIFTHEKTAPLKKYTNEELEEVLLELIEDPDTEIDRKKLDEIEIISIMGRDHYAVNQYCSQKYDIHLIRHSSDGYYIDSNENNELVCGDMTDLNFILKLSDIKLLNLEISYNKINDIGALSKLTDLTSLNLLNNNISDINVLSGLSDLTELNLSWNNISDINALSSLENLNTLHLSDNHINDISALSELTDLTYLELCNNNITDISVLNGLTNLTELNLGGNNISDISVLSELTDLNKLYLYKNPISESEIEALKKSLPNCEIIFF